MRRIGIFFVMGVLVAEMAGCVTPEYHDTVPSTGGSQVISPGYDATTPDSAGSKATSPREETFTYLELTPVDPNVGATLTGPINEEGYIRPSDLQRHSFFSGTT